MNLRLIIFENLKYLFYILLLPVVVNAQFPGPAGQPGSTAINKNDPAIIAWCTNCKVHRGPQNIAVAGSPPASTGDSSAVIGAAQLNGVVSLGDGGTAVCYFQQAITNGPGDDFAVFENSFSDTYLEFAFVEVSSDGIHFFRFPNQSTQDTVIQIGPYDTCNTRQINFLAGKYRSGFGTPFDLEALKGIAGLDVNYIICVRIVDCVGSIDKKYGQRDSFGHLINDPWPTDFASSGFDLDAVGVMHTVPLSITELTIQNKNYISLYKLNELMENSDFTGPFQMMDITGRVVYTGTDNSVKLQLTEPGWFILTDGKLRKRIFVQLD